MKQLEIYLGTTPTPRKILDRKEWHYTNDSYRFNAKLKGMLMGYWLETLNQK